MLPHLPLLTRSLSFAPPTLRMHGTGRTIDIDVSEKQGREQIPMTMPPPASRPTNAARAPPEVEAEAEADADREEGSLVVHAHSGSASGSGSASAERNPRQLITRSSSTSTGAAPGGGAGGAVNGIAGGQVKFGIGNEDTSMLELFPVLGVSSYSQ